MRFCLHVLLHSRDGKRHGLSCTSVLGRFLGKIGHYQQASWEQPRNYSQQSWARTGPGQNNQLERRMFSKSLCFSVSMILSPTISKPTRNSCIHTKTPGQFQYFQKQLLDILTVGALFMETKKKIPLIPRASTCFRYVVKCEHLLTENLLLDNSHISAFSISAVSPEILAFYNITIT